MVVPNFYVLIVYFYSLQEWPEHKVLLFIKNFSLARFSRNKLWSEQSGILHIGSSLFSIFYKVTFMKTNAVQILLWVVEK